MDLVLTGWFVFLFVTYAVSILALTYVQIRGAARYGWRALRERSVIDTYWRELSVLERSLLWTGVVAFGVTFVALVAWKIIAPSV